MFKIRFRTNSFEIDVESDESEFVTTNFSDLLEKATNMSSSVRPIMKSIVEGAPETELGPIKELSLPEFLRRLKPSSGTEYVIGVGFFLEKYRGHDSFTASDIKEGFLKAKFHHSNPSDAIAKARTQGRLMEGPDKNSYVLTQSGEDWAENRLGMHSPQV